MYAQRGGGLQKLLKWFLELVDKKESKKKLK
jgi:hypothetical protein